jgi:hypothetical protein
MHGWSFDGQQLSRCLTNDYRPRKQKLEEKCSHITFVFTFWMMITEEYDGKLDLWWLSCSCKRMAIIVREKCSLVEV